MKDDGWGAMPAPKRISRHKNTTGKKQYGSKQMGYSYRFEGVKETHRNIVKSSILDDGYPGGMMLNLVGPPKSGRTIWALQEAIMASNEGRDVLYICNERGRDAFDYTIDKARQRLGLPVSSLKHIEFRDMSAVISKVAQLAAIEHFMNSRYVKPIEDFIMQNSNPELIIIDSLSKAIRTYPAQAYWAVQSLIDGLLDIMRRTNKKPVFFFINQKSGGSRERNDESVLGGYGCVHDMDGNIVFRMNVVDTWLARDTGLRIGSIYHTVQIMEIRDMDIDTDERIINLVDGRLIIGKSISEMCNEVLEQKGENINRGKIVVDTQWNDIK